MNGEMVIGNVVEEDGKTAILDDPFYIRQSYDHETGRAMTGLIAFSPTSKSNKNISINLDHVTTGLDSEVDEELIACYEYEISDKSSLILPQKQGLII